MIVGVLAPEETVRGLRDYVRARVSRGGLTANGPFTTVDIVALDNLDEVRSALPALTVLLSDSAESDEAAALAGQACLPHLSFDPLGTPSAARWSASLGLSPETEARLWAQALVADATKPAGIALVLEDSPVGRTYENALRVRLGELGWTGALDVVQPEAQPTWQHTLLLVSPGACADAVNGFAPPAPSAELWVPTNCGDLEPQVGNVESPVRRLDPYRSLAELLEGDESDQWLGSILLGSPVAPEAQRTRARGAILGWTLIEEIGVASRLEIRPPDRVNRTSLLVAFRSMLMTSHPFAAVPGATFQTSGSSDQALAESAAFYRQEDAWSRTGTVLDATSS